MSAVMVGPVRLFWTDLDKPDENDKYGCKLGVPKAEAPQLLEKLKALLEEQANGQKTKGKGTTNPFTDGDATDYDTEDGHWLFRAKTKYPPPCWDADASKIDPAALYSGCFVNVGLTPYWWDNSFGAGIGIQLDFVQFAGAGDRLGGGESPPPPALPGTKSLSGGGGATKAPAGDPRDHSASEQAMVDAMNEDGTGDHVAGYGDKSQDDDIPFSPAV